MHPSQAAGLQRGQELAPELVGLAVTHRGAQHFTRTVDGHPGGHHQGLRDHMRADADLAEGGIAEHIRKRGVGQTAGPEGIDLLVQARAERETSDLDTPLSTPMAVTRSSTLRVDTPCT